MNFEIKDDFYIDGKKIKIISGAMHYMRVVPEYWEDRLKKIKALGCNTVETYIAWNVHEPKKGEFNFTGIADVCKFIDIAKSLDLYVILRPGPYICAEWEFGGLPAWLLKDKSMRLRSTYKPYLDQVRKYYKEILKRVTPYQINYGGPVIMMQVENEYGYYGNNKRYMRELVKIMKNNDVQVPIVTSDGLRVDVTESGQIYPEVYPTYNCGSNIKNRVKDYLVKIIGEKSPFMCMEFWVGWFDSWENKEHITRECEELYNELSDALEIGNINIYMAHGGTNFGFMNGAIQEDGYKPHVTSYDYDALISEEGKITFKYKRFKEIISKYINDNNKEIELELVKTKSYGKIKMQERVSLNNTLNDIAKKVTLDDTVNMEELDQNYGYILYRSNIGSKREIEKFSLEGMKDRAKVYLNKKPIFTQYYDEIKEENSLILDKENDNYIDILVENMGRVNLGKHLNHQRKGISEGVMINGHFHSEWDHYCLPLDNIEKINFSNEYEENLPSFHKFNLNVNQQDKADTFIDMNGWGKGCVFVNGFNIGRFWGVGPQRTLYIPAPLLKDGDNEIIVFETEGIVSTYIELTDKVAIG